MQGSGPDDAKLATTQLATTWIRHESGASYTAAQDDVPRAETRRDIEMAYEMSPGFIALKRLGYGPKANGDVAEASTDPRGFVRADLERRDAFTVADRSLIGTQAALAAFFRERQAAKAKAAAEASEMAATSAASAKNGTMSGAMSDTEEKPKSGFSIRTSSVRDVYQNEVFARADNAIKAKVGFADRLVAFWSNHFAVSVAKGPVERLSAGAFEREAIRPFVLGKFADMLLAVESHPAMLHYLDNVRSIGPSSRTGLRTGNGLNENLGREILELHTLGVGSGYSQTDVTNLARILTGWSLGNPRQPDDFGKFTFRPMAHEPGTIALLGKSYPDAGVAQGQAALRDIAHRPETAHFIATKLAQAFVADAPPKALVDRLAHVFQQSKGDLKLVTYALVDAPETWTTAPTKMTTPYDFVIAHHRMLDRSLMDAHQVIKPAQTLGMLVWRPPGPNGYSNSADVWASPEAMKLRLDYCSQLAEKMVDPPNPNELLDALCGGRPSPETKVAVSRAESRQQGLALLLMSPEMQRT